MCQRKVRSSAFDRSALKVMIIRARPCGDAKPRGRRPPPSWPGRRSRPRIRVGGARRARARPLRRRPPRRLLRRVRCLPNQRMRRDRSGTASAKIRRAIIRSAACCFKDARALRRHDCGITTTYCKRVIRRSPIYVSSLCRDTSWSFHPAQLRWLSHSRCLCPRCPSSRSALPFPPAQLRCQYD